MQGISTLAPVGWICLVSCGAALAAGALRAPSVPVPEEGVGRGSCAAEVLAAPLDRRATREAACPFSILWFKVGGLPIPAAPDGVEAAPDTVLCVKRVSFIPGLLCDGELPFAGFAVSELLPEVTALC